MTGNSAGGEGAAGTWTRIDAFLLLASSVSGAFGIDRAFGSAVGRASYVAGQARACGSASEHPAL